jgi:hypothetical protein
VFSYAKTWLFIDVFTIIPFELLFSSSKLVFLKFIKFVKVLKFIRLFKYTNRLKELAQKYNISTITLRLIVEAIMVVYLVHVAACIYYFMASMEGMKYDCWVVQADIQDESNSIKYLYAVYWAF